MEKKMNKFIKILLISSVTCSLFSGPKEDLFRAARTGNSAGVEAAIAAGVDINTIDGWGFTALMRAAKDGHIDTVRLLVDRGANIDYVNQIGQTALIYARKQCRTKVVKILEEASK